MPKADLKPFMLLPPKKGVCQECAVDHSKEYPHNQQSLFYQYYFFNKNARWPTWKDAMEHCDGKMKSDFSEALIRQGAKLE